MIHKMSLCFLSFASLAFAAPLTNDINEFAGAFHRANLNRENSCFSPYSLFSALSYLYMGAKEDTAYRMGLAFCPETGQANLPSALMNLENGVTSSGSLKVTNGIWLGKDVSLLPTYAEALTDLKVHTESLDFADGEGSTSTINNRISSDTEGTIKNLLSPSDVSKMTELVITNAVYFQDKWANPFSKNQTEPAPFYINEEVVTCDMMHQTTYFPYFENENWQLLLLPTESKNSSLNCFFLLPKVPLQDLEKTFNVSDLQSWLTLTTDRVVRLALPRFSVKNKIDAKAVLEKTDLSVAFARDANFLGMTGTEILPSAVLHEAFFQVNETGITASAATAVIMMRTCVTPVRPYCTPFIADHPFLFGVVDLNSGVVLFLGKLTRP